MDLVKFISTKDFNYLTDMFEWNYNAFKQVSNFINEVDDEKIRELLERVRNMHEDHLYYIISILKKDELCDCDDCECEFDCDCDYEEEEDE